MEGVDDLVPGFFTCPEDGIRKPSHVMNMHNIWLFLRKDTLDLQVNLRIPEFNQMPKWFQKERLLLGTVTPIDIPKSNVLIYITEDGTKMAARPSGTEPKIKFYFSINTKLKNAADYKKVDAELDAKIERILKELKIG